MTAKPFFSVIVPVYNVAPYLRVCLDSLVRAWEAWAEASATPPEAECLCIDDGSTDGSRVISPALATSGAAASSTAARISDLNILFSFTIGAVSGLLT